MKRFVIIGSGLFLGLLMSFLLRTFTPVPSPSQHSLLAMIHSPDKNVIGFLPYWLIDSATTNYSQKITTLSYFSLSIATDGSIVKLKNEQEEDPGWNALHSGKLNSLFTTIKKSGGKLSLVVFSGNNPTIDSLVSDPVNHAHTFMQDITPIMKTYGFSDLNIDIESTKEASGQARTHFTQFMSDVKKEITTQHLGTLSVDVSTSDLIKHDLIAVEDIGSLVDQTIIMAYDYHSPSSYVTGPVAPLGGAMTVSEYDVATAVQKAMAILPARKVILGVPLYGYEWETIGSSPRSAVIPETGITASTQRVHKLLENCSACSEHLDSPAQENYLVYKDQTTGTYHQIFYPTSDSLQKKLQLVDEKNLGGVALWALGYEDATLLIPLDSYRK